MNRKWIIIMMRWFNKRSAKIFIELKNFNFFFASFKTINIFAEVIKQKWKLFVQIGGGIVYLSNPGEGNNQFVHKVYKTAACRTHDGPFFNNHNSLQKSSMMLKKTENEKICYQNNG